MAIRSVVFLLCLFVVSAQPVDAGIGEGNGELGFDFGFTDFDSNINASTGGRFSFRGGYHFSDLFQLEGQIITANVSDFGRPGYFIQNTSMAAFLVNAVFNFHPSPNVVPYALIGVGRLGILDLSTGSGARFDENGPAIQAAGGVRFFFGKTKRAAVRLELSFLGDRTFDVQSIHTSLTVGLTWRLARTSHQFSSRGAEDVVR